MGATVPLQVTVNGEAHASEVPARMLLVHYLRDELGLTGTNVGCDTSSCGACTVHIDGEAVRSCVVPLSAVGPDQKVLTLEGLGSPEAPHRVQKAFMDEQAVQCGYCINGMIMQAAAFLAKSPKPAEAEIREALANNICRCGTHVRILRAVKRASGAA